MKNPSYRKLFTGVSKVVLAIAMSALVTTQASAVQRPVEHSLQGTVEAVDTSHGLIKVRLAHAKGDRDVQWVAYKMHTRIVNSKGQRIGFDDLKTGETLRVSYRSHWSAHPQARLIVTE